MADVNAAAVLRLDNTTEVARVGHRLAMGVQCFDALTQRPLEPLGGPDVVAELRAVGTRAHLQRLEPHTQARHALRHEGRYARLLARAVELADSTSHELYLYGTRHRQAGDYSTDNDPRRFVPRRLACTPVLAAGLPPATTANARQAWLWPGAAYLLPGRTTALRGRIRRDQGGGLQAPVPWARVVATRPGAGDPDFATETALAWAHGDDRGEFLLVLGNAAASGAAALPPQVSVHVWVFLPPPLPAFDPADPLASLPLEDGGTEVDSELLRGRTVPAGYAPQAVRAASLPLGEVHTLAEAELLF